MAHGILCLLYVVIESTAWTLSCLDSKRWKVILYTWVSPRLLLFRMSILTSSPQRAKRKSVQSQIFMKNTLHASCWSTYSQTGCRGNLGNDGYFRNHFSSIRYIILASGRFWVLGIVLYQENCRYLVLILVWWTLCHGKVWIPFASSTSLTLIDFYLNVKRN